jgi:ribosomal protein S12 methylthiotransferase
MQEAEGLVAAGIREILVISQDTSAYGVDLKYSTRFWRGQPLQTRFIDLARALGQLGVWVRLHYVYPYPHVDAVIPLMADGLILPYLDIPFQHASPKILKAMKRPGKRERVLERIHSWRECCPELVIRSTFIVGFPGETDDDFAQLLEFLDAAQLDRVGCFIYSPVEGAAANQLPQQVTEPVKQQRYDLFMRKQQEISVQKLKQRVGKDLQVLLEQKTDDGYTARSYADAPEIDGLVYIDTNKSLNLGEFYQVRVYDSDEYDLYGHLY